MLKAAKAYDSAQSVAYAQINSDRLPAKSFDAAAVSSVFISQPSRGHIARICRSMHAALKPNGILVVCEHDPNEAIRSQPFGGRYKKTIIEQPKKLSSGARFKVRYEIEGAVAEFINFYWPIGLQAEVIQKAGFKVEKHQDALKRRILYKAIRRS